MGATCPRCSHLMNALTNFDAYRCPNCGWYQTGLDIVHGRLTDQDEARKMIQDWIES